MSSALPVSHVEAALIERFFRGECSPGEWELLARHLESCAVCRERYQEARGPLLESENRPASDRTLTDREIELAGKLAIERYQRARRVRWYASGGALALAATAALAVTALPRGGPDEGFQARGSDESALGADVLCFKRDDLKHPVAITGKDRCARGSLLKLRARALDPRFREVVAIVLAPSLRWQGSFSASLSASELVTLKDYAELAEAGTFIVVFAFSEQRIEEKALRSAIDEAKAQFRSQEPLDFRIGDVGIPIAQRVIAITSEVAP